MTPERWREIDRVFALALERGPAERAAFLEAACAGDLSLRRDVEALLQADADEISLLDEPLLWVDQGGSEGRGYAVREGSRVGPYRLLREIGEGGMSVVYLAQRDDERYDREVAVKVLKAGLASRRMVARFRSECRILASLEHPNIGRLYDVGDLDGGMPYVVMEYVEGDRIDDYCDRQQLTVAQRLRLFLHVCAAVHYAHRHLVVHRDLKPSNILVTPDGEPKLLDFGIAKLLEPREASGATEATDTWLRPMTPQYASPEQIRGEPISTASDVYSLGVLLYKLLTGRLPYQLEGRSRAEFSQVLGTGPEPQKPSATVRALPDEEGAEAASAPWRLRRASPSQLRRQLAGDIDSVVLAALRREPERRYGSVEQLSQDLERHLAGLPVLVRRSTLAYQARKFLWRHKVAAAVTAVLLVLLSGFTVFTAVQSQRVQRERNRAEEVLGFFIDLFEVSPPEGDFRQADAVRDLLDRGVRRGHSELAGSPEIQATLLDTLGVIYTAIGSYPEARELIEEALALRREQLGEEHQDVATSRHHLARVLLEQGEYAESEAAYHRALELRRRLLGERHPAVAETLSGLAAVRQARGDSPEAIELFQRALAIRRSAYGPRHRRVAEALSGLGEILRHAGRLAEAKASLEEALALRRGLFGEVHPDVASSLKALGDLQYDLGDPAQAEDLYRQVLDMRRRLWGDQHPSIAGTLDALAQVLDTQGKLTEAEAAYRDSLGLKRGYLGERHPDYATTLVNLALLMMKTGDLQEVEKLHRQALEIRLETLGEEHRHVANSRYNLAALYHRRGELEAAEQLYRQANEGLERSLPAGHHNLAHIKINLGRLLVDRGAAEEAKPWLRQGLAITKQALPAGHWRIAIGEVALGRCLTALGAFEEAESLLTSGYSQLKVSMGDRHPYTLKARQRLATLYRAWGKPDLASEYEQ